MKRKQSARAHPRKPLTEEDRLRNKKYYENRNETKLLEIFSKIDRERTRSLLTHLEHFADLYCMESEIRNITYIPKSKQEEYFGSFESNISKIIKKIDTFKDYIEYAARIATTEGIVPPFSNPYHDPVFPYEEGRQNVMRIWPLADDIRKSREYLKWLLAIARIGKSNANKSKASKGSNVENILLNNFLQNLQSLIPESERARLTSSTNAKTGKPQGLLPNFLEAVFRPLGINTDTANLVEAWEKLTFSNLNERPPSA